MNENRQILEQAMIEGPRYEKSQQEGFVFAGDIISFCGYQKSFDGFCDFRKLFFNGPDPDKRIPVGDLIIGQLCFYHAVCSDYSAAIEIPPKPDKIEELKELTMLFDELKERKKKQEVTPTLIFSSVNILYEDHMQLKYEFYKFTDVGYTHEVELVTSTELLNKRIQLYGKKRRTAKMFLTALRN